MPGPVHPQSLREHVLNSIGSFLYLEGFQANDITPLGILEVINLISDYHEEGVPLFPEIIITNSLDFFKSIPNKDIVIAEGILSVDEFIKAVKLCAPLAIDNWNIFIEIKAGIIRYGLVSAEMTETSLSIFDQTVGKFKVEIANTTIAYIRNVGVKTVELRGLKENLIVSLTLNNQSSIANSELASISNQMAEMANENYREQLSYFFMKNINAALRIGHGNLVAVINDSVDDIQKLKSQEINGTYLPTPIDFQQLLIDAEDNKNNETSINLKAYASLFKSMINHDGLTVISNKGRIIAYHLLMNTSSIQDQSINGGARSKAFATMTTCKLFLGCFFKSQDGKIKYWRNNE